MGLGKKKKDGKDLPPPLGLPPLPMPPAPGMPLPPPPGGLPLPPAPNMAAPATPVVPDAVDDAALEQQQSPVAKPAIEALPPSPAPDPVVEE